MPLIASPDRIGFDPAPAPGEKSKFQLPFEEQIRFFRQKLNLPTRHWDDILKAAHDRAFVVAGAMKADLLADLSGAVSRAIADGKSIHWFRQEFKSIVAKNGWQGWTGEETAAGRAWRTRVIYTTNLRTSYAAGRYAQLTHPDLLATRPYWRYVHNDTVLHPRPLHLAWGQKPVVLRHDDPWWKTHFPPNGWGCRCSVTAVRPSAYKGEPAPEGGTYEKVDRNGQIHTLPKGIDYGWDYAPGANATTPLADLLNQKLIRYQAELGARMWESLAPAIAMERQLAWTDTLDGWMADKYPRGHVAIVGAIKPSVLEWLREQVNYSPLSAEIAIQDNLPKGRKQLRHERAQDGLTVDEWRLLPAILQDGAVYYHGETGHLIYVSDGIGPMKAAIEFDPRKEAMDAMNWIVSAFRASAVDVAGMVKGGVWTVVK